MNLDNCHILRDPVAQTLLAELRDKRTPKKRVRQLVRRLYRDLVREVIAKEFPTTRIEGETPLKDLGEEAAVFAATTIDPTTKTVILNLLRGGDVPSGVCSEVVDQFLDDHEMHYLGIGRTVDGDHRVTGARIDYKKLASIEGAHVLVSDCMGATGSTLRRAFAEYQKDGCGKPRKVVCLNLIVTPRFVETALQVDPETRIYAYSLDPKLTAQDYILPGAGDLGMRLTGVP